MVRKTTQDVAKDFFDGILDIIVRNSSKSYGLLVLNNTKKKLAREFPFLKFIKIVDTTVKIDKAINFVDAKKFGKLFIRIIGMLGPDILQLLIKEELDPEDVKYLNKIGVRL